MNLSLSYIKNPSVVQLFGIDIADFSQKDIIDIVVGMAINNQKHKIYNVNVNALNIAFNCPRFRNSLREAGTVFCDGFGVRFGAAFIGKRLVHRNTPPDWLDNLAKLANSKGIKLYFLGDEVGVAARAAQIMVKNIPGLRIVGTHHGFFNKQGSENDYVISVINDAAPDILLVGMGMPMQEFWIDENIDRLHAKVYLPVGAAFRWYSGVEKRAPKLLTDHGFEWLARFANHPVKLFRRYIIGNPLFFIRLLKTGIFKTNLPSSCGKPITKTCSVNCQFRK